MSWLAASSMTPSALLEELELVDTGKPATRGAGPLPGAALADGGYLVVLDRFWHPMIRPRVLEHLSRDGRIVACTEDANTNTSRAVVFREGKRVWQVSHHLDERPEHLETARRVPAGCAKLAAAAKAARAAEGHDTFLGIPAALARTACGVDWTSSTSCR